MTSQPWEGSPEPARITPRGRATRERIVRAAADLMFVRGVNATTLDDVRAASGTSKSQLYHHFPDKDALVHEVIARRNAEVLAREEDRLSGLSSFSGLVRWRNALVEASRLRDGANGCALGSMASELSDSDEVARTALADGLRRMQAKGSLSPAADPGKLAVGLMAALQGGYLLANAAHDVTPMEVSLDMALDRIESLLT